MKALKCLTIVVIVVALSGSLTYANPLAKADPIAEPAPNPEAEAAPEAAAVAEAKPGLPLLAGMMTLPFIHHAITKG